MTNTVFGRLQYYGTAAEKAAFTPLFTWTQWLETDTNTIYAWNGAAWITMAASGGSVGGSGTPGRIAEWTAATTLGDSTLAKTGAGLLTLTAAAPASLAVTGASSIAGSMTGGGVIATGGFTGTLANTGTFALGAGTVTVASTNDVTGAAHTHAVTSSANPGAAASLLASDASGYLRLTGLGIGATAIANQIYIKAPTTAIPGMTIEGSSSSVTGGYTVLHPVMSLASTSGGTLARLALSRANAGNGIYDMSYFDATSFRAIPFIVGSGAGFQVWKDTTPTKAIFFGNTVPGLAATDSLFFATYGGAWREAFRSDVYSDVTGSPLYIPIYSATRYGIIVRGAASQTANLTEWQTIGAAIVAYVAADGKLGQSVTSALTNAIGTNITLDNNTSGLAAAAGFGSRILGRLEDATTVDQEAFSLDWLWTDPTHGAQHAAAVIRVNKAGSMTEVFRAASTEVVVNETGSATIDFRVETDAYDALFVDASNNSVEIMSDAAGKVGFFGVAAVVQQTELTDELTTITHTAPGTPDYAIQDFVDVSAGAGWAFANHDEANSVLAVIANLQARTNELETKLAAYGLLVDAD